MEVVIAGGHGQVARHLGRVLVARGDEVTGLIRDPDQSEDLREDGTEPAVVDLEAVRPVDLTEVVRGAEAVVFAAGAGSGSGAARKETVDYGAAVKLREAARGAGVDRYVMVSAMGTDEPPEGDDVFSVYLRAKARADRELVATDLAWTVVRPGRLTDAPGTGRVRLARHVDRGEIPREDVAAVLAAVLHDDRTIVTCSNSWAAGLRSTRRSTRSSGEPGTQSSTPGEELTMTERGPSPAAVPPRSHR